MKFEIKISVKQSDNISDALVKEIFESQLNYGWYTDKMGKIKENSFGIENGKITEYNLFVFTVISNHDNVPELPPFGSVWNN